MTDTTSHHPIEHFIRQYLPEAGGVWECVEPQVYDLLLPETLQEDQDVARVVFDPEALPEHPGSQFMTLGTPLVDRLLEDARRRGRYAGGYVHGLNLHPYGLEQRIRRSLDLPPKVSLAFTPPQPVHVTIAVFWFEATFISDQKEQAVFHAAVDLHQLRHVRHLERLLEEATLSDQPVQQLDSSEGASLTTGYRMAREQVTATVAAAANLRRRELAERTERQLQRMAHYYRDLLAEADARLIRANQKQQDPVKEFNRRRNIERERDIRLAEARKKAALRVQLRLSNLLTVHQPKLRTTAHLARPASSEPIELHLTWDPLLEVLEPLDCPRCAHPVFALRLPGRDAGWCCPTCAVLTQ
ncbi:MAG: hypothetical protein IT445_08640 [Phycisphaeraceae bacterium]|nr:hypothetical protein [Phycisphaeraceae bacterium]